MASVFPELRLFLKKRSTFSIDEIVALSDNWAPARGDYQKARQSRGPGGTSVIVAGFFYEIGRKR